MSKMGRPLTQLIYDDHNNMIVGLSFDVHTSSYFSSYKDEQGKFKKQTFGRNKKDAISKFRSWQEKRKGGKLSKFEKPDYLPSIPAKIRITLSDEINDIIEKAGIDPAKVITGAKVEVVSIPVEYIYQKACELIDESPTLASQKLKLPFLADPNFLKDYRPAPSYTLEKIGETYFNKVEFRNATGEAKHEVDKVRTVWTKFSKVVGVNTIAEITRQHIQTYYDDIYTIYVKKDKSTTWIKGYFKRVITVLNSAAKQLDKPAAINDVKLYCSDLLKVPEHETKTPAKKIPKNIFWRIIENSDAESKAMWLISGNLAYYTVDVANLPLDAIDFENKTVIFRRGKTGQHRAGILWQETIDAILVYQKEIPHRGKTLFFNMQDKQPYVANRIRKRFVAVLKKLEDQEKAKVEEYAKQNEVYTPINFNYTHNNFRDSFQSICVVSGIPEIEYKSVLGHTRGITGKYIDPELNPDITNKACLAVYNFYFG